MARACISSRRVGFADADRGGRAQGRAAAGSAGPRHPADAGSRARGALLDPGGCRRTRACSSRSRAPARSGSRRSRAARPTVAFCELDAAALGVLRENAARLRYADRCTIKRQDGRRRLAADSAAGVTYDLILLDPPYRMLPTLTDASRPPPARAARARGPRGAGVGRGRSRPPRCRCRC